MPDFWLLLSGQMTWNWSLFVACACTYCVYIWLITKYTALKWLSCKPMLFLVSILLLYAVVGSPLAVISHLSFSLHMIQMSILYFLIPPLLLLGIPESLFQELTSKRFVKTISRLRNVPIASLYLFALLFLLYHLPFMLTVLVKIPMLQNAYLFVLFILSFGMWWPMVSPDPKQRLAANQMKQYAMNSGYILLPACLLFILTAFMDSGNNALFNQLTVHLCLPPSLGSTEVLPSPFNTKYDQALSGFFMLGLHKVSLGMVMKYEGQIEAKSRYPD